MHDLRNDRRSTWLSYGCVLAIGVAVVLLVFLRLILTGEPLPDDYFFGDMAAHVIGQRAFFADRWHWPLLWTTLLGWARGLSIARPMAFRWWRCP